MHAKFETEIWKAGVRGHVGRNLKWVGGITMGLKIVHGHSVS